MTAPALVLDCTGRSDVGRRPNNEDAWFASARLAAVADGVGGAAAGEVASRTLINAIIHLDKCRLQAPLDRALADAVVWGDQAIGLITECRPELAGMATTLTAAALDVDGCCVVANVGDSRTYLLRDGALTQLTRDESYVQELLEAGLITPAEARAHPHRSVVSRAVDGRGGATPVIGRVAVRAGDRLLLCSDGLSDVVDDPAIAAALRLASRAAAADRLVALALDHGARDNVSVVVADVVARPGGREGWLR